jgi:hypothetical protein
VSGRGYGGFNVTNGNRIYRPSHPRCRLDDGGDRRGILSERMPKLEQLSFFRHPDSPGPTHGVFQFSLPLNQAKSFV